MQLPSREGVLERRRCTLRGGVGLPAATDARATTEAPGLGAGSGGNALGTWLLRMGMGLQPAASRTGTLANFLRTEHGKIFFPSLPHVSLAWRKIVGKKKEGKKERKWASLPEQTITTHKWQIHRAEMKF